MLCAHTNLEAQYAYLGMALQGNIVDGLFGPLRPVVAFFFIVGILYAVATMALRGQASNVLAYLVVFLAIFTLLHPKLLMTVDTQAMMTGESGSQLSKIEAGARANALFFVVARAVCAVRDGILRIIDASFGKNVAFQTSPFTMYRGTAWALTQELDDAGLRARIGSFFDNCLGPTEDKLQREAKAGSIFGYFGNLGDLVGFSPTQEDQTTMSALEAVPYTPGPGTCADEAKQIKSLWAPWVQGKRDFIVKEMGKSLSTSQLDNIIGTALYSAAVKAYGSAQGGVSQELMPGGSLRQDEFKVGFFDNPSAWMGQKFGNIFSTIGEGVVDFVRGFMQTVVPGIQGWAIMLLYAVFPIVALMSVLPNMYMKIVDYIGALWWVHSWSIFLSLISHILEALYGLRGGAFGSLTELGAANTDTTRNAAWIYLFLVTLTPLISYKLFFGRIGELAGARFRFVGLGGASRTAATAARFS